MKKIFLEQKGHPHTRAFLEEATFHAFLYKTWRTVGPKSLRRHFTRFPFNKNSCLKFREFGYRACRQDTDQWS